MTWWIDDALKGMTLEECESFFQGKDDASLNKEFDASKRNDPAYKAGYSFGENSAWEMGGGPRM